MADEPDLTLAGLSIWARSREFSQSDDYWDGNWIDIRARVEAPGSFVETSGPWIRSDEIAAFLRELEALHRDLRGTAELQCMEPMLNAKVAVGVRGQVEVIVEITPDHLTQSHRYEFAIDQSYLGATLSGCRRLLDRFPVKGSPAA
jgi:hypothetical protein